MRLYKNVDLCDLSSILNDGIKSLDASGNNNWKGKRAPNATDVVYLFSPKTQINYFPQYGVVLLEVEIENAKKNELLEYDYNKEMYDEYIIDYVSPDKIKNIYIPNIFETQVKNFLNNDELLKKINFVSIKALCYENYIGYKKIEADEDILKTFGETAVIKKASYFGYFMGRREIVVKKGKIKNEIFSIFNTVLKI